MQGRIRKSPLTLVLGYVVVSAAAPGMTARESFERKPRSFQGTVLAQRFERVLGTGRRVAARSGSEGRYAALIELYQHDQRQRADPPKASP